jgi:outer membrane protein insertion porin family
LERTVNLDESTLIADVKISISPGSKSYFGELSLQGDSIIPRPFILNHIEINKGDLFSNAKLEATQKNLYELGLFKYVTLRASLDSVKSNFIPIGIQVKELPRWSLKAGLGYGTEDKIRISAMISRLSFLGGARSLHIKANRSYFVPINVETRFIQPDIFVKDLDFIVNPYFSREREESYEVDRWGIATSFQKKFNKNLSSFITYSFGKDFVDLLDSTSLVINENNGGFTPNKSGLTSGASWNKTDNLFSPTKGWKVSGTVTYMGIGFNTQYNYIKLRAEAAYFFPLSKNIVVAAKLNGGIIDAIRGNLSTPIEDRFLIGGASSLRGWGRNQISPVNSSGLKTGGNSVLEGSLELRFPIYGIFSGTTFFDFGNTWQNTWYYDLNNLLYNVGFGLRIKTPVGPIRFDIATPIINEKFRAQFFITIGQAF